MQAVMLHNELIIPVLSNIIITFYHEENLPFITDNHDNHDTVLKCKVLLILCPFIYLILWYLQIKYGHRREPAGCTEAGLIPHVRARSLRFSLAPRDTSVTRR